MNTQLNLNSFSKITLLLILTTQSLAAYAPTLRPQEEPISTPYVNPYYNQGLQPKDSKTHYSDGNLVRQIPDTSISNEIQSLITSGYFSEGYQNISYSVNDGIVTLNGHVTTPENKIKLEDKVRQVSGVVLINNQISIFGSDNKPPHPL